MMFLCFLFLFCYDVLWVCSILYMICFLSQRRWTCVDTNDDIKLSFMIRCLIGFPSGKTYKYAYFVNGGQGKIIQ